VVESDGERRARVEPAAAAVQLRAQLVERPRVLERRDVREHLGRLA
jgi:hypothetical protein